jgi:hypothetical protein
MTVQRSQVKIALLTLMLSTASMCLAAGGAATVSGVVRDADGVAQMGALVQVLANGSVMVGTAFTDLHGRYVITRLIPGKYQVRASAALFVPATHGNLQLRPDAQAVVNLTLNTIFASTTWLPAERRKADEPGDDWKWTLRSAVNRPILRMVEDGNVMTVSSSVTAESTAPTQRVRGAVTSGDGGFGTGGVHNVVTVDRVLDDGAGMVVRADIGTALGPWIGMPSMDLATGYERRMGFAGSARTVISYQSHPELIDSSNTAGLQTFQMASAQKMQIGDAADVEVGGLVYVVHTSGYAVSSRPFLKVTAHPASEWTVGYRMATSRDLQSYAGLNSVQQELPVSVMSPTGMRTESGLHQEFAIGRKVGPGLIQIAYYLDSLHQVAISGGGALSVGDIAQASQSADGVLADEATGSFRVLNNGYKTQGINLTLSEPLTSSMWVALEYSNGAALTAKDDDVVTLQNIATELTPVAAQSATVAVKGRVLRSGTKIRAAYRWQPAKTITAVNPYAAFSDQAYLSCYLRQAIKFGNLLPPGLEATVDVTNLLAEGYRPFLSADGKTLFLAQSPRAVRAGLAFTF